MKWNAWWMDSFKKKISFNFPLERIKLSLLLLDLSLIPNAQPTITVVSGWETTYPQVFFRKLRSCVSCACLTLSLPCLQRCHFHNDQWSIKLKIDKPFFLPYYIILKCSYHIFAIFVVTFSFVEKIFWLFWLCPEFFFTSRTVNQFVGSNIARLMLWFMLLSTGMFISCAAFLPSSFSMYLTMVAVAGWISGNNKVGTHGYQRLVGGRG